MPIVVIMIQMSQIYMQVQPSETPSDNDEMSGHWLDN